MASVDSDKARKSLTKKGFVAGNTDHKVYELWKDGKLVLHTKISHGSKHELDNYLIKQMSDQCKLDKNQFLNLIRYPLSKDEYFSILAKKGLFD